MHTSQADQKRIFLALTRKYDLHPDFDVDTVLAQCATTFTGADLYALCSDAMLNAVRRSIDEIEAVRSGLPRASGGGEEGGGGGADSASGGGGGGRDNVSNGGGGSGSAAASLPEPNQPQQKKPKKAQVLVTSADFLEALANLTPSVTREQMKHYESLHAQFSPDS